MNVLLILRIGIVIVIFTAGFSGGIYASSNHFKAIISNMMLDAEKAARIASNAISAKITENDELKTRLGVQHAAANDALNILLDHPAQRVRLPVCLPASTGDAYSSSGSAVQAATTERTDYPAQVALDEAIRGMESDAAEWSRALNACAVVMGWAKEK